jgi:putative nucleotidyltransferase with HDIG domain
MPNHLLDEARLFLVHSLRGRQNQIESRHPWRRNWEFAVLHSLRVEAYTARILAADQHSLSGEEITLLRLAAILHDIARLDKREEHAKLGAEIARRWLTESSSTPLPGNDVARVAEMIADHSNKASPEPDYSKAVLKDADTLDEIGVMSIFMATNWVEMKSPFFFHELRQRLDDAEIPYCDRKLAILNTQGAKHVLQERKAFLESFIAQITDELQADAQIEQLLLDLYRDDIKDIITGEKQDG